MDIFGGDRNSPDRAFSLVWLTGSLDRLSMKILEVARNFPRDRQPLLWKIMLIWVTYIWKGGRVVDCVRLEIG
jgi:hypothetical protein